MIANRPCGAIIQGPEARSERMVIAIGPPWHARHYPRLITGDIVQLLSGRPLWSQKNLENLTEKSAVVNDALAKKG